MYALGLEKDCFSLLLYSHAMEGVVSVSDLTFRSLKPIIIFNGSCLNILALTSLKFRVCQFSRALVRNDGDYFIILSDVVNCITYHAFLFDVAIRKSKATNSLL